MRQRPLSYQPNIIVINCDDAPLNMWDNMPLMQANWLANTLDYERNGSSNGPLCAPARAATLSGLRMPHHKVWDNSSGGNFDFDNTFLVALRKIGYRTGAVGKWMNGFGESGGGGFGSQTRQQGLDVHKIIFGNPNYFDYDILNEDGTLTHHGTGDAAYATRVEQTNVLAFLNGTPVGTPFCLYWAPKCPHKDSGFGPTPDPDDEEAVVNLIPAASFGQAPKLWGNPQWMTDAADAWTPETIATIVAEHKLALRALLSLDRAYHAMMQNLQASGRLANTFIFFKTDNAHAYGELRQNDKGTPHRSASSMLLRVWAPSGLALSGQRKAAVSDIDIASTVCHLAGAQMNRSPDGMSFYETMLSNDANFRAAAPLDNLVKDSPLYRGLWYGTGRVWYEGLAGGKAAGQFGGWDDKDMLQDIGWQQACHDDLEEITKTTYVMP